MTRDELRALANAIEIACRYGHETERQASIRREKQYRAAAAFLRQIADAKPEHWIVELRWADRSRGDDWWRYMTYGTAEGAESNVTRAAGRGDMEARRVVPLYRLPIED